MLKVSKKSVLESSIFGLHWSENYICRLCPRPLGNPPPPPPQTPKEGEKDIKRGQTMLYIGYLIILDAQRSKKNQFRKVPFLSCTSWKTTSAGCALDPLEAPPLAPPNTPIGCKTHKEGIRLLASAGLCTEAGWRGGGPSRVQAPVASPKSPPPVSARWPRGTSRRGLGLFRAGSAMLPPQRQRGLRWGRRRGRVRHWVRGPPPPLAGSSAAWGGGGCAEHVRYSPGGLGLRPPPTPRGGLSPQQRAATQSRRDAA